MPWTTFCGTSPAVKGNVDTGAPTLATGADPTHEPMPL